MKPFDQMPAQSLAEIRYLLSDIDDTLTIDGVFPAKSYAALEALRASGRHVVLITGRPAGWCDMMARFFPIDAVIGENGALCFYREGESVKQIWHDCVADREANLARLHAMAKSIIADFPGTALAQDNPWRASDVAVDFAEDVPPLPLETANAIQKRFSAKGATAKVSSIHVNAWIGDYDKYSMFAHWLKQVKGVAVEAIQDQTIYTGDSPNDVPMFKRFAFSTGVQGIENYNLPKPDQPTFVTRHDGAHGFEQVANALLSQPVAQAKAK